MVGPQEYFYLKGVKSLRCVERPHEATTLFGLWGSLIHKHAHRHRVSSEGRVWSIWHAGNPGDGSHSRFVNSWNMYDKRSRWNRINEKPVDKKILEDFPNTAGPLSELHTTPDFNRSNWMIDSFRSTLTFFMTARQRVFLCLQMWRWGGEVRRWSWRISCVESCKIKQKWKWRVNSCQRRVPEKVFTFIKV